MTCVLTLTAIRRHLITFALTGVLLAFTANLLRIPVALCLAMWLGGTFVSLEAWYAVEPAALRWLWRCRAPSAAERQRVEPALGQRQLNLLITERDIAAARGLRCLVVSQDLLDLCEDRALSGLLNQVAAPVQAANLAGFAIVWSGSLLLRGAGLVTRVLGRLGELLALLVGKSLVVPLVVWRDGFVRWTGRLFASIGVGVVAAMLLINGYPALGFLLMIAWLAIPCLDALLAWESRASERVADRATVEAGYGFQLLEAVELLGLADSAVSPGGVLGILRRPGVPIVERALWLRRLLYG